jgi:hypothetical protein
MEGHFSQRLSMNGQIVWYKCNNFLQIDVTVFYGRERSFISSKYVSIFIIICSTDYLLQLQVVVQAIVELYRVLEVLAGTCSTLARVTAALLRFHLLVFVCP